MAIKFDKLTFADLAKLDPRIELMFKKLMGDMARDCENRPYDKTSRKVNLKFVLTPVVDPEIGELAYTNMEVEGGASQPIYRSKPAQLRSNQGQFEFNVESPGNLDQPALPFEDQENEN